LNNFFVET